MDKDNNSMLRVYAMNRALEHYDQAKRANHPKKAAVLVQQGSRWERVARRGLVYAKQIPVPA